MAWAKQKKECNGIFGIVVGIALFFSYQFFKKNSGNWSGSQREVKNLLKIKMIKTRLWPVWNGHFLLCRGVGGTWCWKMNGDRAMYETGVWRQEIQRLLRVRAETGEREMQDSALGRGCEEQPQSCTDCLPGGGWWNPRGSRMNFRTTWA